MFDPLTGEDIGNKIARTVNTITHDWPNSFSIQGGKSGIVFTKSGETYRTAYVEVFPLNSFIRGEGRTVKEAEDNAWKKYQQFLKCPVTDNEHSYKPFRRTKHGDVPYFNGAGFCEYCDTFTSNKFTAADLNCKCETCGEYSFYSIENINGKKVFGCEKHPRNKNYPTWV